MLYFAPYLDVLKWQRILLRFTSRVFEFRLLLTVKTNATMGDEDYWASWFHCFCSLGKLLRLAFTIRQIEAIIARFRDSESIVRDPDVT